MFLVHHEIDFASVLLFTLFLKLVTAGNILKLTKLECLLDYSVVQKQKMLLLASPKVHDTQVITFATSTFP